MADNGSMVARYDDSPEAAKLITAVVQRGKADEVAQAAIAAGAQAATIAFGRGQGVRERLGLLGLAIQPEKEIISIVVEESLLDRVVTAMVRSGKLDQPGIGFLYVTPVEKTIGLMAPSTREDTPVPERGGRLPFRGRRG